LDVTKRIVLDVHARSRVLVHRDLAYGPDEHQRLDVYLPPNLAESETRPGVVFVHGDAPPDRLRNAKDRGQFQSWGELVAQEGLTGITFNHRSSEDGRKFAEASRDVSQALAFAVSQAAQLKLDGSRLCVWTCSGGPPLVLPELLRTPPPFVRCVVCYYGEMDLETLRDDFPADIPDEVLRRYSPLHQLRESTARLPPMLIVRADQDWEPLNTTIDAFVAVAASRHVTIDFLTHPDGSHAFDVLNDVPRSKEIIESTLQFIKRNL
jgi:acetyl esterase/lipase